MRQAWDLRLKQMIPLTEISNLLSLRQHRSEGGGHYLEIACLLEGGNWRRPVSGGACYMFGVYFHCGNDLGICHLCVPSSALEILT